ncbi:MAG: AhpC/TSA family protein [Bacteroidales bacterium]|nr:AhpC/TSA family protein [Bacteroidales bacterium]
MKKILSIIFAVAALCACSKQQHGYVIKGQAGDLDGKAVLSYALPDGTAVNDTVAMNKGRFTFKGSVPDVVIGSVALLPAGEDPMHTNVYVENCPLTMNINLDKVIDYARYGGKFLSDVTTTGGPNNEFADKLQNVRTVVGQRPELKEVAAAIDEVESMGYSDMAAYQQKQAEIQSKFADQLESYYNAVEEETKKLIAANPDVEAAAYMFNRYYNDAGTEEFEEAFNKYSEKVRNSFLAAEAREELAARKATQPGAQAPDFTLNDPEGKPVTLSSLRGQYVIVDFWASWCKPCRAGMPAMKELYKKYHPKGLEIIGVSDDTDHNAWKNAIEQDQTPWIHVVDEFPIENRPARVGLLYGVHYIPSYFLLDKEGKVIGKMEHEELETKLAELLD